MCLTINHEKPLVASKDIKVYKHVSYISNGTAKSPFQGVTFDLDKDFVAKPESVHLRKSSDITWDINEGVIHACLWPDFDRGRCLEAYIPKGTQYWYGVDKSTICAKKLYVTSREVKPEDSYCQGLDKEISSAVYIEAPSKNGIKIGSFLVHGDFVNFAVAAECLKSDIQGIVVGFNGNEPVVADILNITPCTCIDTRCNRRLHTWISDREEAMKDMSGYEHTKAWKKVCESNPDRYEAYHKVIKLSENHYIPALGEMELIWKNLIYIAASCSLAEIACPFVLGKWFWTSTEFSEDCSWHSYLLSNGACRNWNNKNNHNRIVPFVASANLRKKNKLTWIRLLCNSLKRCLK